MTKYYKPIASKFITTDSISYNKDNKQYSLTTWLTNMESTDYIKYKRGNVSYSLTEWLNKIYPVGCVWLSTESTNPGNIVGGSWTKIEGRFLWATGNTPKQMGGSRSHSHGSGDLYACMGSPAGNADALGFTAVGWHGATSTYSVPGKGGHEAYGHNQRSHDTAIGGSTASTETLPPYFEVYMYYRTA